MSHSACGTKGVGLVGSRSQIQQSQSGPEGMHTLNETVVQEQGCKDTVQVHGAHGVGEGG